MRRTTVLTESELRRIVDNNVKQTLNEVFYGGDFVNPMTQKEHEGLSDTDMEERKEMIKAIVALLIGAPFWIVLGAYRMLKKATRRSKPYGFGSQEEI